MSTDATTSTVPPATVPPATRGKDSRPKNSDIPAIRFTIEIAGNISQNVMNPITRNRLRGRWSAAQVYKIARHQDDDRPVGVKPLPDEIPGMRITVDTARGFISVTDPLNDMSDPVNADIVGNLKKMGRRNSAIGTGPTPNSRINSPSPSMVKAYTYWCRRWVDSKQAVIRSGSLPTVPEINKLPGDVNYHPYTDNHEIKKNEWPDGVEYLSPASIVTGAKEIDEDDPLDDAVEE